MAKYKNISDFRHAVVLNGNKKLLRPGDVFESDKEFRYAFLEQVSDDTPVTVGLSNLMSNYTRLENEIESIKNEKEQLTSSTSQELQDSIFAIKASVNDLRNNLNNRIVKLEDDAARNNETLTENLVALRELFTNFKSNSSRKDEQTKEDFDTLFRRLDMVKNAIITIENVVYGDESGN